MDYSQNLLAIPESSAGYEKVVIPLLIYNDEKIKHGLITIKKQDLNENVIANSISPVHANKIISSIINISEEPFIIDQPSTQNIEWESYCETIFKGLSENEIQTGKIEKLKTKLERKI